MTLDMISKLAATSKATADGVVVVEHSESMYKTTSCRSFSTTGVCPYGLKCLFAHGPEELRSVADNELLKSAGISPKSVVNTNPARRTYNVRSQSSTSPNAGLVSFQTLASRLDIPELRPRSQSAYVPPAQRAANVVNPRIWESSLNNLIGNLSISSTPTASPSAAGSPTKDGEDRSVKLFKTELCRSFSDSGSCPYGLKCLFAHGEQELRAVDRHRKYKTEQCKKFHSEGVCPFGSRCIYIHDEDERELPNSESYDPAYAAIARQRRLLQSASPVTRKSLPGPSPLTISPSTRFAPGPQTSVSDSARRFNRFSDGFGSAGDFIQSRMSEMQSPMSTKKSPEPTPTSTKKETIGNAPSQFANKSMPSPSKLAAAANALPFISRIHQ